ncbi:thyrotropin subunit beta isoform X1 [Buteo buteo]|uniref:thyrotropin subunit beta isoform X1 n=1 Tax=Buteo buteo TaxID=30397 RepID=UPI003EB83B35
MLVYITTLLHNIANSSPVPFLSNTSSRRVSNTLAYHICLLFSCHPYLPCVHLYFSLVLQIFFLFFYGRSCHFPALTSSPTPFTERMSPFFVMSLLFGLAFGQTASLCAPSEYTIHVEKRECAYCLAINTTICAGFCMTRDSNGKKLLLKSALSQNVCTYKEMLYQTALIPGCPHHTIPYYSYPVAVSCKCGKCNTDYSDCVHEKVRTNYCTKPQKLCNM